MSMPYMSVGKSTPELRGPFSAVGNNLVLIRERQGFVRETSAAPRALVGAVVVHNQAHVQFPWHFLLTWARDFTNSRLR